MTITEPGVYDIPEAEYHADPVEGGSVSCSELRRILPPSCPAIYRWERDHPGEDHAPHYDIGSAVHTLVLGVGAGIRVIDADSWRTKDAREARDAAYADGAIPLLPPDAEVVEAMAAAVRAHPIAGPLFSAGVAEQTVVWRDERTGLMCRSLVDWLPEKGRVIVDLKTSRDVHPDTFARSGADYGYHVQAAFYTAGVRAVGLRGDDAAFINVAVRKEPPHLVTVLQWDSEAMRIGAQLVRSGLDQIAHCTATGVWPDYGSDVHLASLPPWLAAREGVA